MYYKKHSPPTHLSKYIECIFIWEGYSQTVAEIETPPSAFSSIVFNYKEPYKISNSKNTLQSVPKVFIAGQAIRNYTLHVEGEIGMIGIVFKPAGLYNFIGFQCMH